MTLLSKSLRHAGYSVFQVDCLPVGLQEGEPAEKQIRVKDIGDDIVYQFHCNLIPLSYPMDYFLMSWFCKKLHVLTLEDVLHLDPNCQDDHRHYESRKYFPPRVPALQFTLDLGNRYEKLLPMVGIEGELVYVAKDTPVGQMSN